MLYLFLCLLCFHDAKGAKRLIRTEGGYQLTDLANGEKQNALSRGICLSFSISFLFTCQLLTIQSNMKKWGERHTEKVKHVLYLKYLNIHLFGFGNLVILKGIWVERSFY